RAAIEPLPAEVSGNTTHRIAAVRLTRIAQPLTSSVVRPEGIRCPTVRRERETRSADKAATCPALVMPEVGAEPVIGQAPAAAVIERALPAPAIVRAAAAVVIERAQPARVTVPAAAAVAPAAALALAAVVRIASAAAT